MQDGLGHVETAKQHQGITGKAVHKVPVLAMPVDSRNYCVHESHSTMLPSQECKVSDALPVYIKANKSWDAAKPTRGQHIAVQGTMCNQIVCSPCLTLDIPVPPLSS